MMKMMIIISLMFSCMNHPISMGIMLIIYTIMICINMGMMYTNFFLSYILFLVMIGGMLILFMYMTSIASNEKFFISNKLILWMLIMIMLMNIPYIEFMMNNIYNFPQIQEMFKYNLIKYFNYPFNYMLILLIIYLLITLIATVKIINMKSGPLRQINL